MRTATYLIATVVITSGIYLAYGQNEGARAALQQKLASQFTLTQVSADRSDIVKEGTAVLLKRSGMTLSSFNEMPPCSNTVKNGGISTDMFCKLVSMSPDGSPVVRRQAAVDEKLWLIDLRFEKSDVNFLVYSEAIDGVRYYAWLKFPFDKRQGPNPDEVTARIAEVLTIQPADNSSSNAQPAQAPGEAPQTQPGEGGQSASVLGVWVQPRDKNAQLQLNSDGTFSEPSRGGGRNSGKFTVSGDQLILTGMRPRNYRYTYIVQGDKIYLDHVADNTLNWVRPQDTPPPPPPPAPLALPATYVSAQAPADQLHLNADNSFSLQAAGETYHGTFVVNGNTVELNIRETGDKTTATIHGNNLTDSSGQTWERREQSAETASGVATLGNQDVIKMVKAGLGDDLIISKIASSKCQFDTSTDALIELKQSGVSSVVLKALVGPGK